MALTATASPADILKYQSDLVRTGNFLPLGRINKMALGPAAGYTPPVDDPFIAKFGRLIDLRDRFLPLAMSHDRSQLLITGPLLGRDGRVNLPDVPDPNWRAPERTREEIEGVEDVEATARVRKLNPQARPVMKPVEIDRAAHTARMIPQRLEDRTSEVLAGSKGAILVFQPVENLAVQPEKDSNLLATAWVIEFAYNPADGTHACFMANRETGECHLYGGRWTIKRAMGEE
jgi:hypothetical protein